MFGPQIDRCPVRHRPFEHAGTERQQAKHQQRQIGQGERRSRRRRDRVVPQLAGRDIGQRQQHRCGDGQREVFLEVKRQREAAQSSAGEVANAP
ncbi:hypothetical protein VW23_001000 [Devosia insulae DS-56]|uniref:Uncharacterized protein n=1 Tax=Devosia insulae DS-56 TaxID=1116389 RepID=A0A1E5XTK7_9HYPH|nr:hypothetical protein VW23_001000 [Devosia insulae DS-56]